MNGQVRFRTSPYRENQKSGENQKTNDNHFKNYYFAFKLSVCSCYRMFALNKFLTGTFGA
jgi:hypothetical protein